MRRSTAPLPRPSGRIAGLVAALALLSCVPSSSADPDRGSGADVARQGEATMVFLVRHAERAEDGTSDPPISQVGEARAELLAEMLRDTELTHVHTTDYLRTRATARPAAEDQNLDMVLYDPDDLEGFARHLRSTPGRHLVLGHSNTTPDLVRALGGDPHGSIEEMEYDRLYVLTLGDEGVSTVLLRFGSDLGG